MTINQELQKVRELKESIYKLVVGRQLNELENVDYYDKIRQILGTVERRLKTKLDKELEEIETLNKIN